jgi:hypothetical protein
MPFEIGDQQPSSRNGVEAAQKPDDLPIFEVMQEKR